MKLSAKQQNELRIVKYFIPSTIKYSAITDDDTQRFFDWSDRGIDKEKVKQEALKTTSGLSALYWGKQRRDLQLASWSEDWGNTLSAWDFEDEPEFIAMWVADKLKKPGIKLVWYEARAREYRRKAHKVRKEIDAYHKELEEAIKENK